MSYRNAVTKGISTMLLEVDEETLINVSAERFNEIKQILLGVCSDELPQNV